MNKETTIDMIAQLSNTNGISGFEDEVVNKIRRYCDGFGVITEDSLRNLYIDRKGNNKNRPVVQIDAHSDEVGFMVQAIRPNGMLQIIPIGSWVVHNIPAHKVWVRNREGNYIPGVVSSKPPHFMAEEEKKYALQIKQITVDVGASSKEEAEKEFKIRIGEPIVPWAEFEYMKEHDLMIGKAFDNRLGCASIISILKELEGEELNVDIIATITSQEEIGTRGAIVASRNMKPDIAIVMEGAPADDTFVESCDVQTKLRNGPMLRHSDAKMLTNPRFQRYSLDLAQNNDIPIQEAVRAFGSTNSAVIHIADQGVPTIVIGMPVRYAHTHYGIASYNDYENSVKLACQVLRSLNKEIISGF